MKEYFGVTPPSVHQMVLTLEANGLIERTPGMGRSIRLLIAREQLPDLVYSPHRVAERACAALVSNRPLQSSPQTGSPTAHVVRFSPTATFGHRYIRENQLTPS